jgi:hypothetical protein
VKFRINILHDDDSEYSGYESMIVEEVEAESEEAAVAAMHRTYTGSVWAIWAADES